jgi:hypothetical protein
VRNQEIAGERHDDETTVMTRRVEMRFCANEHPSFLRPALLAAAALALLAAGCNSSSNSTSSNDNSTTGAGGRIDVNCIGNHVNNPPEAFHYSYKTTDGQNVVDKQADITPQNMEITIQNKSGSHKYQGVRSDEASWDRAVLDLSGDGFTLMSARIAFIKDKTSVSPAGAETTNGYQTTKYSIDTTSANSSDRRSYETLFGSGSYEKGAIWVTADGCPVKLILDEGTQKANGSVDKSHYEMAMVKK